MTQHLSQLLNRAVVDSTRRRKTCLGCLDRGHLSRVGDCAVCGAPVAAHFNERNIWVGHPVVEREGSLRHA
ncbi:MAG: hypothetical protein ABI634_12900 [Acidobacteriota bacterium]